MLKTGRQLRQEPANLGVTAKEVDHIDQRLHACFVGRAAILAQACLRHGITEGLAGGLLPGASWGCSGNIVA